MCRALLETLKDDTRKVETVVRHARQCTVGLFFITDNDFVYVMSHRLAPDVSTLLFPAIRPSLPSAYPPQYPNHPFSLLESQRHFQNVARGEMLFCKGMFTRGGSIFILFNIS